MNAVVYTERARRIDEQGDDACDHSTAIEWLELEDGSFVHWLGGALGDAHGVHVVVKAEAGGRRARVDERPHEKAGAVYTARWAVCSDVGAVTFGEDAIRRQHVAGEVKAELGDDRAPLTDVMAEAMQVGLEHALVVARRLEAGSEWGEHVVRPREAPRAAEAVGEGERDGQLGLALG